jgi:hypothetical protein
MKILIVFVLGFITGTVGLAGVIRIVDHGAQAATHWAKDAAAQ